uniref:Uncharacterized protein n=1 Tax=Arundo donax TaxID=35708 RepID=A0A0A8ZUC5_ARUDO
MGKISSVLLSLCSLPYLCFRIYIHAIYFHICTFLE